MQSVCVQTDVCLLEHLKIQPHVPEETILHIAEW